MSDSFKILREETFIFKKDKLYLMLVKDNGVFGVEVVDSSKTFGRQNTTSERTANKLFDTLETRLSEFNFLKDAKEFVEICLSAKTIDKFKCFLVVVNKTVSQKDIVSLSKSAVFKTEVKVNYLKNKKKKNALTVYLFADNEKKAFGLLTGTTKADNLIFEFL